MATTPKEFTGVTANAKANVYFEGKDVSHTILLPDGLPGYGLIRRVARSCSQMMSRFPGWGRAPGNGFPPLTMGGIVRASFHRRTSE